MVAPQFKILFLIFLLNFSQHFSQTEIIAEKKDELDLIKQEISSLEEELKEKTQQEKASNSTLENYNKQSHLLNKVLRNLKKQQRSIQKDISKTEDNISEIKQEIKILQDNYAKYLVAVYKKGEVSELESILDANSVQQAVYRVEYLNKFSEKRKSDLEELNKNKLLLQENKFKLEQDRKKLTTVLDQKKKEENELNKKLNERKKVLTSIKKDKKEIKKSLDLKKESHQNIERLITKLVEEENRRKKNIELKQNQLLVSGENAIVDESSVTEESIDNEYELITSSFQSFKDLKGKMIWPIHRGKIYKKFGENKNKTLKTVTINYGLDIKVVKDKNVKCVADGIVSAIDWLPGYGSVIIVTHKDNYRTVYGHLAEIFVSEGDMVRPGTVLAKVGESIDGLVLHFEIWNSRIFQNPSEWLAKN